MSEDGPAATTNRGVRRVVAVLAVGAVGLVVGLITGMRLSPADREVRAFDDDLLADVRDAALMSPGALPERLHAIPLTRFMRPASTVAEGAGDELTRAVRVAYEVVWADGRSLMVDAGLDAAFDPDGRTPTEEDYGVLQERLRDADMIVVTHAHLDHVAGIVRSPWRDQLERSVLFTEEQMDVLLRQDTTSLIRLTPDEAERFVTIDYEPIVPVAPGVVLIRAPGHTRDSQFVYVRLASGDEVVFAGDVSNLESALRAEQQKPERSDIAEDREAIAEQMRWLRALMDRGIHVLLSHDDAALEALINAGLIEPLTDPDVVS